MPNSELKNQTQWLTHGRTRSLYMYLIKYITGFWPMDGRKDGQTNGWMYRPTWWHIELPFAANMKKRLEKLKMTLKVEEETKEQELNCGMVRSIQICAKIKMYLFPWSSIKKNLFMYETGPWIKEFHQGGMDSPPPPRQPRYMRIRVNLILT